MGRKDNVALWLTPAGWKPDVTANKTFRDSIHSAFSSSCYSSFGLILSDYSCCSHWGPGCRSPVCTTQCPLVAISIRSLAGAPSFAGTSWRNDAEGWIMKTKQRCCWYFSLEKRQMTCFHCFCVGGRFVIELWLIWQHFFKHLLNSPEKGKKTKKKNDTHTQSYSFMWWCASAEPRRRSEIVPSSPRLTSFYSFVYSEFFPQGETCNKNLKKKKSSFLAESSRRT